MVRPALWLVAEFAESEEDASAALDVIAAALPLLAATDQVHTHVHIHTGTLARTRAHAHARRTHTRHTCTYIHDRHATTFVHTITRTYRHQLMSQKFY